MSGEGFCEDEGVVGSAGVSSPLLNRREKKLIFAPL
jgi:hypothetical protein